MKYQIFMSQLKHIEDLKETEKTKISVVYHEELKSTFILRICKNRDLSDICSALLKIRNANTVVVYDFVYENGDTYILEENVVGDTLSEIMEYRGPFTEQSTAKIIVDVCKALEGLHRERPPIVHNDINPSNIKIREDGSVKLFDFDISRVYKKGQSRNTVLFGTEEYASPEHFGYGQSEPRTDIYCLGVTMHKMLTDKELSAEHRITYNGKLKNVIEKCLEFDPKNRYDSVTVLRKDLEKVLTSKKSILYLIPGVLFVGLITLSLILAGGRVEVHNDRDSDKIIAESSSSDVNSNQENLSDTDESIEDITTNNFETSSPEVILPNNSRESAMMISLGEDVVGDCDTENSDWYKFRTSAEDSIYRIGVTPIGAPANTLFPYLYAALYDTDGIKLEEFDVWSDDKYDFVDLHLEKDKEYFVKISLGSRYSAADYEMIVSNMICDAGLDKESAAKLSLGNKYNAVLDSTLSDWYVFDIPEDGDYTYTIHNIDVGCDIYFSIHEPRSAGTGNYIKNEDNYSGTIRGVLKGEQVYFQISSRNNYKANGKYIVEIEKFVQ